LFAAASDLGYGSLKLGDTLQTLNGLPVAETILETLDATVGSDAVLVRSQKEIDCSGKISLSFLRLSCCVL